MMSASIRATVVIPLYNDSETIISCIRSVLAQSIADMLEIIIVDDGSTDDGPRLVEQYPVVLLRQQNAGPSLARNAGAQAAHGEILIFLDADCQVEPGWAEAMLEPFNEKKVVASMGGIKAQESGLLSKLIQIEIEQRYRRLEQHDYIDFFASVVVAFRREYFISLSGFRPDFRYNEDVELAYRIHSRGGAIVFVPMPRTSHLHPRRWRDYFLMKYWRGVWRMWLYRLYPRKAVSDNWTPDSLKLQIILTLLLPLLLCVEVFFPMFGWTILLTLGLLTWSSRDLVRDAYNTSGWRVAIAVLPFVMLRSLALSASIVTAFLIPSKVNQSDVNLTTSRGNDN